MRASCNNFVRLEPKRKFGCPEDLITLTNELHSKGLLPQVIVCFDDNSEKLPSFKIWEWRVFLESDLLLLWCFQENLIVVTIVKKVNVAILRFDQLAFLLVRFDKFWILFLCTFGISILHIFLTWDDGHTSCLAHTRCLGSVSLPFFRTYQLHIRLFLFWFFTWHWNGTNSILLARAIRSPVTRWSITLEGRSISARIIFWCKVIIFIFFLDLAKFVLRALVCSWCHRKVLVHIIIVDVYLLEALIARFVLLFPHRGLSVSDSSWSWSLHISQVTKLLTD